MNLNLHMSKKKLFLLDGMALAYRAHFAFINSRLKNSEGIATGPVLGFANTLVKLLEEETPTHIAVAWDTHAPTFRHDKDDDYKANRPPQPEELKIGIPLIKEMVKKFGIRNLEQDGFEADDVIGTLAVQANAEDTNVVMVTPDKDFMQLVHDHIEMMKPDNNNGGFIRIDRAGVLDYFGVYPEQVIDVLAIIGDSSDNIPGVPGIGKKGAPEIIQEYGTLEKAIEEAPNMKSKRHREGLSNHTVQAMHAKMMVTIKTDVPNIPDWEELDWQGPDKKELGLFFKRMEFRTLTKKFLNEDYVPENKSGQADLFSGGGLDAESVVSEEAEQLDEGAVEYRAVVALSDIEKTVKELSEFDVLCFDTETDSPDPVSAKLVGISFCGKQGKAVYIPVNVEGVADERDVVPLLAPLFANEIKTLIAHNYKFDYMILRRCGVEFSCKAFDTMVAAYLLDASQRLKMDDLSRKYLKYSPIPIEKLIGIGKNQKSMADIPYSGIVNYACEDADITYRLYEIFLELMKSDELVEIADNADFPLLEVLAEMELKGIRLDIDMLGAFSKQLEHDLLEVEKEIYTKTESEFNINSPQQLGDILFNKMKLPSGKKTKTGQYSTSEEVLSGLAVTYDVPALILDYRSLSKLKSTYADALPKLVYSETGRIHTSFNQTVAATGRLSSSNPNLQNIPIRTERGREIRKAFIADEGFCIMSADYSQVELRVIASISEDENMIAAFKAGEDIHARTAKEIFNLKDIDEVTPDHRRKAKEVNFGIPYGVSAYGLATRLGISNGEGKEMIDQYFARFPGVQDYINHTIQFAKEHGYVKTLMGRRRYIPDIQSRNFNVRGFAERTAINMPIQGTAADIIKLAMIQIHDYITKEKLKSRMLLQVHDELVFELHVDESEAVSNKIKELMESAVELKVPLKIDMGRGENWLTAH